ncbi:unnamed protein product [Citrullus colocynthis]|uniref:Uncharacterized protein n=1 Tax=Citrullus colocynthis TaxID=252529 RepID=A0ABP0Z0X4_9ROSI
MESLTPDLEDFENSGGASSLSSSLISSTGFCIIIHTASVFSSLSIFESRFLEKKTSAQINFSAEFIAVKNLPRENLSKNFSAN